MRQFSKKAKDILIGYAKKNVFFRKMLRQARYMFGMLYYFIFYAFNNTDKSIVMFESYLGRSYSCSPKALYESMLKDKKYDNFKYIWAFIDPEKEEFLLKNKNTKVVQYGSKEYFRAYAKAKYWITNSRIPEFIKKRKDQIYVQTWHGTPFKKIGFDAALADTNAMCGASELKKKNMIEARRYTYMISPSRFCSEKYISSFNLKALGKESIILESGYPRNDFLFNYTQSDAERVKSLLGISKDKKVILYAPTWRDDQHKTGVGYVYNLGVDFKKLQRELKDDYAILFRTHYFIANKFDFSEYDGFIIDASAYEDINDLYIISDILITDYSSVFFDFANLKRPIIFYMYDLDKYQNQLRDFYFDLKELPGNVIKNEEELIKEIKSLSNSDCYDDKYMSFNKKFNYLDGKYTSVKALDKIIEDNTQ